MFRWLRRLVVGGLLVTAGVLAVLVIGMRTKTPAIVDGVRRMNRAVMNPRQMASAGTPGAYAAVIHHVGRRSGTDYVTPVGATATDDGFLVALPYGDRADWLRNVLASGTARLDVEGESVEVDRPEVVAIADVEQHFSAADRRAHRLFGVDRCLVLHRAEGPASAG